MHGQSTGASASATPTPTPTVTGAVARPARTVQCEFAELAIDAPPSPELVPDAWDDPVPALPSEPWTPEQQARAAAVAARAERIRTCAVTALQQRILDHFAGGGTSATWDSKGVMREVLAAVHGAVGHGAN